MAENRSLSIEGIPAGVSETDAALCRSRLLRDVNELMASAGLQEIKITVSTPNARAVRVSSHSEAPSPARTPSDDHVTVEERARRYTSCAPLHTFDRLVVPSDTREELLATISVLRVEKKVFDEWGLRAIEPFPRTVLNFHGRPGTGKTLAAHALASYLGRKILVASYAEIESKFHGDGPKNVQAIFYAAERDQAVLFIDEADSLLSKRLTSVTQGADQAINSMRSQLLICLETFRGVVVFSTNLIENYDKAFETRVRHVAFSMPDEASRREIWRNHIPPQLPVSPDVTPERLAVIDDVCGRDIKNAVIDCAVRTARAGRPRIELLELEQATQRIKAMRIKETSQSVRPLENAEKGELREELRRSLNASEPNQ